MLAILTTLSFKITGQYGWLSVQPRMLAPQYPELQISLYVESKCRHRPGCVGVSDALQVHCSSVESADSSLLLP